MDGKELEIIEKRIGGTTPAPWITGSIPWQVWYDGGHGKICRVESCASDREFIAHARQDVPALLDEVKRLNLQNSALEVQLSALNKSLDIVNRLNASLQNALNDYGQHHGACPMDRSADGTAGCICGLDALLKPEVKRKGVWTAEEVTKINVDAKALQQELCEHKWAHIEDHYVICEKCKHTADLCWTCESEKTKTSTGALVCLKCNPQ